MCVPVFLLLTDVWRTIGSEEQYVSLLFLPSIASYSSDLKSWKTKVRSLPWKRKEGDGGRRMVKRVGNVSSEAASW